jgi:hypothetical protein
MSQSEKNTDAKQEVSIRLEVEVAAVVEADFTTDEELLAWLDEEKNRAALVGLIVSYMERDGTSDFLSAWLDENRELYLKEILEVELKKFIRMRVVA